MASNVDYRRNDAGMRDLMNSPNMCESCTDGANGIAARANGMFGASGYEVSPGRPGRNRAHAIVYTGDIHSMRSNRLHNTLLKSLK